MVLILFAAACMHQTPPPSAGVETAIHSVALMNPLDSATPTELPDELLGALSKEASSRNIGLDFRSIPFDGQRQTMQRLEHVKERPLLLIETRVWYMSQLEGRFRWEVEVTMSLAGESGSTIQREFSVPVFHQYHHLREDDALVAASPVIRRQLGGMLDDYIRGEGL